MASGQQLQLRVLAANMDAALRKFHRRKGDAVNGVSMEMAFDDLLEAESDGIDGGEGAPGEYEYAQRRAAIRGLFRYLKAEGLHPLKIMKRLWAVGRGLHDEYFASLTMHEAALMFGETKAAHSWRMKFLSGLIEKNGMHGSRLPGQKTKAASESYSRVQKGNSNRRGGKRSRLRKKQQTNGKHYPCPK